MLATIQVARRLRPGKTVVTLLPDSGLKYLNTDVYRSLEIPRSRDS
jgi:cysteine synthase